jgi:hypothetical protein
VIGFPSCSGVRPLRWRDNLASLCQSTKLTIISRPRAAAGGGPGIIVGRRKPEGVGRLQHPCSHPEENIHVLPGDVITVVRDPQTFTAFGATGRSEKIPFDTAGVTLEEAIARRAASLRFSA